MSENKSQRPKRKHRSFVEWVSFSISFSLVALIVSLILYSWFNGVENPPVISLTLASEIRNENGQYYVPFEVTNTGGGMAEAVQVIAELQMNGNTEMGEQQISFLSSGEVQKGVFIFTQNPEKGDLKVRVASYKIP